MKSGNIQIKELLDSIKNKGDISKDLHVTRICCALVAISNGKVIKTTTPLLKYCPLSKSLYEKLNLFEKKDAKFLKNGLTEAIKSKISAFGYFTKERELYRKNIEIPYGASEMLMYALEKKGLDVAVIVCDGAGTIISSNPGLVQGIGARMNGLFYTSPISEVTFGIENQGGFVIFPKTAKIDQIAGLKKAIEELGFNKIALTINGFAGESLNEIRKLEKEKNISITILVVCTTGIDKRRAEEIKKYADLAWSCVSVHVRDIVGKKAKIQIGVKIPVFVLTKKGIDFLNNYSPSDFGIYIKKRKKYLIAGFHTGDFKKHVKISMGNFEAYLREMDELPLRVEDAPRPLI